MFSEEKDSTVLTRIKEGNCPICGKELKSDAVVVNDARYGKVKVCNTHKVATAGVKDE